MKISKKPMRVIIELTDICNPEYMNQIIEVVKNFDKKYGIVTKYKTEEPYR